jgi:hypothetical protein
MSAPVPQHDDHDGVLGPPRFTLRALLGAVTALGCLFGLMTALGTVWSMALVLFLTLIAAHVAGNSLGTKLRDRASRRGPGERPVDFQPGQRPKLEVVSPQPLTQRARLNRVTLVVAAAAALAGGALGGAAAAEIYPRAGAAALALGAGSSAILGAFVGFAVTSFVCVVRAAMREALCGCDPAVRPTAERPKS